MSSILPTIIQVEFHYKNHYHTHSFWAMYDFDRLLDIFICSVVLTQWEKSFGMVGLIGFNETIIMTIDWFGSIEGEAEIADSIRWFVSNITEVGDLSFNRETY